MSTAGTAPSPAEWAERAEHLRAIAAEVYQKVPGEWWASQPEPVDNRIRNN